MHRLPHPPSSRTVRHSRLKSAGKFFAFISAQVLIGFAAFVLVSDYMADGYIKNAVSNIIYPSEGDGNDSKIDPEVTIVVKPPLAQGEVPNQEITIQKLPAPIEPVETPPAETQKPVVSAESKPLAEEKATAPVVEPEPQPKAKEQVVAVVPTPDLTPLKDAPAAVLPSRPASSPQADGEPFRDCPPVPNWSGLRRADL